MLRRREHNDKSLLLKVSSPYHPVLTSMGTFWACVYRKGNKTTRRRLCNSDARHAVAGSVGDVFGGIQSSQISANNRREPADRYLSQMENN